MSMAEIKDLIPTEEALCAYFTQEFNALDGWTCYPETGGFDVVVVHDSGRQIGVEAKLQLNAKVADQILPEEYMHFYGRPGPDHRLVIVRTITEASYGIARMLQLLGVPVWHPRVLKRNCGRGNYEHYAWFAIERKIWDDERVANSANGVTYFNDAAWFDWNPPERIELPGLVPDLPAGVPAPVRLTPWKIAALRVVAKLRAAGCITTKEIAAEGISPSVWIYGVRPWLDRGPTQGTWVESDRLPAFDKQHPEIYTKVSEELGSEATP